MRPFRPYAPLIDTEGEGRHSYSVQTRRYLALETHYILRYLSAYFGWARIGRAVTGNGERV